MTRVYHSLIFFLIFVAGCSAKPYVVTHVHEDSPDRVHQIYVVSHGWHTGIIVPASDIQAKLPQLISRFGPVPLFEFGWGDRGFYQASEITTGLALRAILWPTETVVHAVPVPRDVGKYYPESEIQSLCLSDGEYLALTSFIVQSFHKDERGQLVETGNIGYDGSQFYKGAGEYYLTNTCNTWTAKGLKSAGLAISPTFTLTAGSVMNYLRTATDEMFTPPKCGDVSRVSAE